MLESLNYDGRELRESNQNMQTYISSCKKEHVAYTEQKTAHIETFVNITFSSESVSSQQKQKYQQEYCKISYDKNEANKSMNPSKTIDANETIEKKHE